jgi:hypothetical protein
VAGTALIALPGCGSDPAAESATSSSSSSAGASSSGEGDTTAAAERLEGRYAHFDVVAYESTEMKTLIISYGFTDLAVVDDGLQATESFCFSEHRSDQPIEVQMSDAATSAITPIPTLVTLTEEGGRASFSRPATPTGIGIHLEDPANDPLPTDPADPRIADDDGDGNPGVTAHITLGEGFEGELYLARREIFAYDVDEQDDGSLTGVVTDDSEQLIVGATSDLFLTQAEWIQHPDLSKSPIILEPVEDDWDCERLRAERDTLFPPTPEVDW